MAQSFRDESAAAAGAAGAKSTPRETTASTQSSDNEGHECLRTSKVASASDFSVQYPTGLIIRNTFLEYPAARQGSLDEFLRERQVRSAPGSKIEGVEEEDEAEEANRAGAEGAQCWQQSSGDGAPALERTPSDKAILHLASILKEADLLGASVAAAAAPAPQVPQNPLMQPCAQMQLMQPVEAQMHTAGYPGVSPGVAQGVPQGVMMMSQVGTPECPTVGSIAHAHGQCKPCAFVFKPGGCGNGVECPFCHLCDANEKKRRQKERRAFFHFVRSYGFGSQAPDYRDYRAAASYDDRAQSRMNEMPLVGRSRSGGFREAASSGFGSFFRRG